MEERPWFRFYKPGSGTTVDFPRVPLFRLLQETAESHPDLIALAFYGQQISYGELWSRVCRMANALTIMGLRKGDRVMVMLPNCPGYVIAYYGTLLAGGVVTQVNPLYVEREVHFLAQDSGARFMVVADALYSRVQYLPKETPLERIIVAEMTSGASLEPDAIFLRDALKGASAVAPEVAVDPEDVAVLQYTGGTTGLPKGAMLTHLNLVANAFQSSVASEVEPGNSRVLTILPLFHSFGMLVMNVGLKNGSRLVLLPRFEIDAVMQAIKEHEITDFPGVPTMYVAVLNYPNAESYGIHRIKNISSGGAAMPVEVMQVFVERFGAQIGEGYGLSEASPATHANPNWDPSLRKPGSIGVPMHGTDARIVDMETGTKVLGPEEEGELCIRGPQVMKGYWNRPEETATALRDGWLYTGDIAKMDQDGYFYILDRKKDMIIVSGYNVYPREIEEILYEHPGVMEAAVISVPDAYKGEVPKAFIVLRPGAESVTPEEIVTHCRERLAPFKIPKHIEFRAAIPKSAVGKILRRELAAEERQKRSEPQVG